MVAAAFRHDNKASLPPFIPQRILSQRRPAVQVLLRFQATGLKAEE